MRHCYFSLGSNVGDRGSHLNTGIEIVRGSDPYRISQVYETEPVGGVVQDDFWNLVLEIETDASALDLLANRKRNPHIGINLDQQPPLVPLPVDVIDQLAKIVALQGMSGSQLL